MMNEQKATETLCQDCWNQAIYTYGTGYIFSERARKYKWNLNILAFLGIVVPVTVGSIILSFQTATEQLLGYILPIAGTLSVIQLIMTTWALVAQWQNTLSYAEESASSNYRLSRNYESLAQNPPHQLEEFQRQYSLLEKENELRTQRDNKQNLTEKEKRKGMRSGLRQYQRKCLGCGQVPQSMKPSNCDICGNF